MINNRKNRVLNELGATKEHRMVNQVRNREFARLVKIPSRTKRSMKERNLLEDCKINKLKED